MSHGGRAIQRRLDTTAARAKLASLYRRWLPNGGGRDVAGLRGEVRRLQREVSSLREDTRRILDRLVEFEVRSRRDMVYVGDQEAALESHHYARRHMLGARHFRGPLETLRYGLSLAPHGGMAMEFGVATGTTLRIIADERTDKEVYGFDSFEGLPETWMIGMNKGAFARDDLPDVPGAELVVGMFDDVLPRFLQEHTGRVDFLHIDSDLYSSAKTVLDHVGPRLQPGSVIAFDEFFNYPGWQEHECRAWEEYVERTGVRFTYEAYAYENRQVIVRITD